MGAGSREQLLVGDFAMILRTSLSVTAEKTFSEHVNVGVGKFNWCLERSGSSSRILPDKSYEPFKWVHILQGEVVTLLVKV